MIVSPLSDGTLHSSWQDISQDDWEWPNFTPEELSSNGSGEFYWHVKTFDALQRARQMLGLPLFVNSAHRDWLYNLAIGGAPLSAHLFIAADISTRNHNRLNLYAALKSVGFESFGFYETFIHVDMRQGRMWYGTEQAKAVWARVLAA